MPPTRGDTICGHVVIDALAPMQFGARAFGPVYLAHTPEEPQIWLTTIARTLLPRTDDVARFMAGVGELLHATVPGAVDVVVVAREADFCVVGHRADPRARTLATIAEAGADDRLALELAHTLAHTLADLHARHTVHGLVTPATVVRIGERWWTWQHGIVKWCVPERLGQRLRPPGGDPIAPEVRAGQPTSPASDVFAWAASVACLLAGAAGSEAITLLEIDGHDDPLRALVRRCLEASPGLRPADGAQLVARLDAIARQQPGRHDDWAVDSGEASFADLFDDLEPARAPPAVAPRVAAPARDDEVELLFDLELELPEEVEPLEEVDLLEIDEQPEIEAHDVVQAASRPIAPVSPVVETPSWREIAERYLAEDPASAPRVGPRAQDEAAASTAAAELARVALVRARVRPGPPRPLRVDASTPSGEGLTPDDADPEPTTPAVSHPDARELPAGVRVPAVDGDEPGLHAFPDPEPGEISVAEQPLTAATCDDDREREPEPGPDDTLRLVPLPQAPPLPELPSLPELPPLAELPPMPERPPLPERPPSGTELRRPADERLAAPRPVPRRSAPFPVVPTAKRGNRLALALAGLGAVTASALAISAALQAGGLSHWFEHAPEHAEAATSVAVVGDTHGIAAPSVCPSAMAPIAELEVCIDRAEFPGAGQMPRTHVALAEAERACTDRGRRLCAPHEWQRACRGLADAMHPYGPTSDPTRCNGADADGTQGVLVVSGASERCVSASGVFNLEGNVAEWVEGGAALGGDTTTHTPSCDSRAQPGAETRAPTLGFRCCLSMFASAP